VWRPRILWTANGPCRGGEVRVNDTGTNYRVPFPYRPESCTRLAVIARQTVQYRGLQRPDREGLDLQRSHCQPLTIPLS
jgi:hypothetical protein